MTQKIINTYYNPQEKKLKTSFNTFIAISRRRRKKMGGKRNATNKIIKKQKANITYIYVIYV